MPPTLEQERALHAWNKVQALKENNQYGKKAKDYGREAKKMSARILTCGLGQALAFIQAKSEENKSLKKLHNDLTDWVIKERKIPSANCDTLLLNIIHGDSDFMKRATNETLSYLVWLTRFIESELGDILEQGE
ncbi:type III-B CRISPR module-associated protein Cmr5 [Candidatus Sumerlaeota bacterium]|nr:type III-B CRISPR module-associated protein Cmr5 [Candidatus Sumerlaeota bacterium]